MNKVLALASPLLLVLSISHAIAQGEPPRVAAGDIDKFVGKMVAVCGQVKERSCLAKRQIATLLLDEERKPRVSIGFRSAERARFGARFEDRYMHAEVCAAGTVQRIDGKFVVMIDDPSAVVRQDVELSPAPLFAPEALATCDPTIEMPRVVREVRPQYSPAGLEARIQGVVWIEAVVLPDGSIGETRVVKSLSPQYGLDAQALAAVKAWRFRPAMRAGTPVPVVVTIELTFRL